MLTIYTLAFSTLKEDKFLLALLISLVIDGIGTGLLLYYFY